MAYKPHTLVVSLCVFNLVQTFCLTVRAYLNTQNYGLFCSLRPCIIHNLFNKSTIIFYGLYLSSDRKDIKMFNSEVEPWAAGECFRCKVWNILTSFLWSIRVQTVENCCRFFFTTTLTVCCVHFRWSFTENPGKSCSKVRGEQSAREKSLSYCKTFLPHPLLCESSKVVPGFLYCGRQSKECVTGHALVAWIFFWDHFLGSLETKLRIVTKPSHLMSNPFWAICMQCSVKFSWQPRVYCSKAGNFCM